MLKTTLFILSALNSTSMNTNSSFAQVEQNLNKLACNAINLFSEQCDLTKGFRFAIEFHCEIPYTHCKTTDSPFKLADGKPRQKPGPVIRPTLEFAETSNEKKKPVSVNRFALSERQCGLRWCKEFRFI